MKAKFQIGDLLTIGMIFVVTAIGLAFGLNVLSDIKSDFTANSVEANATQDAIEGVSKFTSKFGILATIVVAAIIIGVLYTYFMRVTQN
jgi:type II secretory pathway component PulF